MKSPTFICRRTGKIAFREEIDAKIALSRRVWKDKGELRHYACEFGKHYHMTSQRKKAAA